MSHETDEGRTFVSSPAPYSYELMPEFRRQIEAAVPLHPGRHVHVYDPMAGNGQRLQHLLAEMGPRYHFVGSEIEPEFAGPGVTVRSMFDYFGRHPVIVTSPAYGNRMADQYLGTSAEIAERARSGKKPRRVSYAIALGRKVSPNSGAGLQWGPKYRHFHAEAWQHVYYHNLAPGGQFILNVKSHYRGVEFCDVAGWHAFICNEIGFRQLDAVPVETPGMRDGENREKRDSVEWIFRFSR